MLKLRRGTVVSTEPLTVRVGDRERRAWADECLVGPGAALAVANPDRQRLGRD